jgi:hypothetical protein
MMGVRRKRGAKARVDEQKPDRRRERGTSRHLAAKSISIKDAKRKFGDGAQKAAELTWGDLAGKPEVSRGHTDVGKASEALQVERRSNG